MVQITPNDPYIAVERTDTSKPFLDESIEFPIQQETTEIEANEDNQTTSREISTNEPNLVDFQPRAKNNPPSPQPFNPELIETTESLSPAETSESDGAIQERLERFLQDAETPEQVSEFVQSNSRDDLSRMSEMFNQRAFEGHPLYSREYFGIGGFMSFAKLLEQLEQEINQIMSKL